MYNYSKNRNSGTRQEKVAYLNIRSQDCLNILLSTCNFKKNHMKNITLNDGHKIPILGFGTYKALEQEGIDAVVAAIDNGYTLIDTASIYKNEEAVGKGIKASGVAREKIYLTTKLWREYLGYDSAKKEFEKSLKNWMWIILIYI